MPFLIVLLIAITLFVFKHEKIDSKYRFGWGAIMMIFIVLYVIFGIVL